MHEQKHVAISADGVPIYYDVYGSGPIALVFVHGWCCNRHYWDRQVRHFAQQYKVVALDLAGHGASGRDRNTWTMPKFGEDVVAVVAQLGLDQAVLIGHSMGGPVIVEAARRLPNAVIGVVGVDTLWNVEHTQTPEQVEMFLAPFRANFVGAARTFVRRMFVSTSDATLVEHIVADMSAAPPDVGIGASEAILDCIPNLQEGLREVNAPIIVINADGWQPTHMETAQRYGIEVVLMSGVGHFVMLEAPEIFNRLLDETVKKCIHARAS
jgi:pimeloyl-ACP methyl ester carboxylesterase